MSNDVYLSLAEAKKYVGRGFNASAVKVTKNEYGTSLGYSLRDLDAFIAKRENSKKQKINRREMYFQCEESEYKEIQNFKKTYGMSYREIFLRVARNINKSPELLAFFKEKFK